MSVARRRFAVSRACLYSHACVLEIGCGLHPLFSELSGFKSMTVVEAFQGFADDARALSRGRKDVEILEGVLSKHVAALSGRNFDFVAASSLIHEVPDDEELMSDIRTVAGKKTVVHISTSNARSFHRLLALEMGLISDLYSASPTFKKMKRQRIYDIESLQNLARRTGFRVVAHGSFTFKPFTNRQMERLVREKFISKRMLAGIQSMSKYMPGLGSEIFVDLRKK